MKNIFRKAIAVCLICALFAYGNPFVAFATEEGTEPVQEAPVPASEPAPEPEPKPEPKPEPAAPDPDSEPDPAPQPEPQPEPVESVPVEKNAASDSKKEEPEDANAPSDAEDTDVEPSGAPSENKGDNALPPEETKPSDEPTVAPETAGPSAEVSSEPTISPEDGDEAVIPAETPQEIYIVSFDTASLPVGINVAYGTPEAELGLPAVLKASWSNESVSEIAITWKCIDDDNGGSSYIPAHENPAAVYTFKAVLAEEVSCSAELPRIYVAYEAIAAPLDLELIAWEDVIVEFEDKEYEVDYKSIALNTVKTHEFGLSRTEDKLQEPDPELKYQVDDSLESHDVVLFEKLLSDTEYTVWTRELNAGQWTAFVPPVHDPIRTDAVSVKLKRNEETIGADGIACAGDTLVAVTNLEEPAFKWYREGQSEPVCEDASYTLSLADVGTSIKCVANDGNYSAETADVQILAPAPHAFRLDAISETLTVVFAEDVPAGARVVLEDHDGNAIAAVDVNEAAHEFSFEDMRAQAGNTVKAYIVLNEAKGAAKDFTVLPVAASPAKLAQDQIRFAAASQRSIDFSCTEATGYEFAYRATGSDDALTEIRENPFTIGELAAQTDYTLYMRSSASEAGFASDWVEAGFNATTDMLEVAVAQEDNVYFDSTIVAAPARNYLFAEGYPIYQWYVSDEATFDESATLLEDVHGAELNLQEKGFSKADIGKYIFVSISDGFGNTSAPKSVLLRRYEDPLLSLSVDERITVGETATAVYSGESTELVWQWLRGDVEIAGANTSSYTAVVEDANSILTVNAILDGSIVASAYVAVDMCLPVVAVDYVKETLTVSVISPMPEGWTLRVTDEGGVSVDKGWPKGSSSVSYTLAELGIDPDRHEASAPDYAVAVRLVNAEGEGEAVHLTLPTRRDYSEMTIDMNAVIHNSASELTFVVPSEFNMALSAAGSAAPDFSLGSGPSFSLKEGTRYTVWLQDAAVQGVRFASGWMDMHVAETGTRKEVSVTLKSSSVKWNPDMEIPGINISNGDVSKNDVSRSWYDANGKSLSGEPSNAGKYTLKLSLKGNAAKWYKLKETKLSLTIEPITMSAKNTRVTCEQLTYNGKEQLPQKMKVIVDGIEIPAGEFETEKVSGYDCTKAGSHIIKVVGKGNVSGGIKILYVISKAKPAVITWPTAGYLMVGQKLSQSALSGGSANAGSFAWENGSIVPAAGISKHNVVFTPADTANYDWTGVATVKPVEVRVYFIAPSGDDASGTDSDYNYDFSASSGYWDGWSGDYEEGEAENSSIDLAESYLSAGSGSADVNALEIVYDVIGQPMDYELLAIYRYYEEVAEFTDHTFMIAAQPDMEGEIVSRVLRLSLAQLDSLRNDMDFSNLLFRNGDADLCLRLEEVLAGDVGKLAAYMLDSEESEIDLMDMDFASMDEVSLDRNALSNLWLEARIDPVVVALEDETGVTERDAWDVSLWLCTEYSEIEVSTLIPSFRICLNVSGLSEGIPADQLLQENGIALVDEYDEMMLLQSELIQIPGEMPADELDEAECYTVQMPGIEDEDAEVWTDYAPDMNLNAYRNDVLATAYAGAGMYMLMEIEEGF